MCSNSELLNKYREFLKDLAERRSSQVFTNGGGEFASILMGTMSDYTRSHARIFCTGFGSALVLSKPYCSALQRFLDKSNTRLEILVETDEYANAPGNSAMALLRKKREERGDDTIQIRKITNEAKESLLSGLNSTRSNFSVFDDEKYRLEYEPEKFKAIGSFNQPESAKRLAALFDDAFRTATVIS